MSTQLHNTFVFSFTFFQKQKSKQFEEFEANMKQMGEFNTGEDFWSYYELMKKPTEISQGCQFFCFKKGIRPFWDDPKNQGGCKYSLSLKKQEESNPYWENMLIGFIRTPENFPVNGVTINIRACELILAAWLRKSTEEEKEEVKKWLQESLKLLNTSCLQYKAFPESKEIDKI